MGTKKKWSDEERQARIEEQRARRREEARQQHLVELEEEIHQLEEQMKVLQDEISSASAAQEAMRIHELGMIYGEMEVQLQDRLERWAELAG